MNAFSYAQCSFEKIFSVSSSLFGVAFLVVFFHTTLGTLAAEEGFFEYTTAVLTYTGITIGFLLGSKRSAFLFVSVSFFKIAFIAFKQAVARRWRCRSCLNTDVNRTILLQYHQAKTTCYCHGIIGDLLFLLGILGIAGALLFLDKKLLGKVDYMLLLTFVCFFVVSENLGRVEAVRSFLQQLLGKNTLLTAVGASQVISNVPAAVLLSPFTDKWQELLAGVNIGGLGTPIASLASLISLKLYMARKDAKVGRFLLVFTAANIVGLALLLAFAMLV